MAKKKVKTQVSIEIRDEKLANVDAAPQKEIVESAINKSKNVKPISQPAMLISRLNHPEYVDYDGNKLPVAPRAKLKIDKALLESKLPVGLLVKNLK